PGYSISKAATLSMTLSLRALLAGQHRPRHPHRTCRYRYDPERRFPEGFRRVRGRCHLRWPRKRRKGDFPGSYVPIHRRGLAQRRSQGARTPVRSFRTRECCEGCVTSSRTTNEKKKANEKGVW